MNELLASPERILKSLSDGVYVCDTDRRITYWSASAERITGWAPADVIGRKCLEDVLCHIDKDGRRLCGEEHCPLHRSMITGSITQVPVIVFAKAKDGRRIPMQVTAAPILGSDGGIIGGVETFRDVSPMLVDLRRARKIQQRILEQALPDDPRLKFTAHTVPQDIVGGDYVAVRALDQDRYGFMVADMEGHGVAAALYTMHLNLLWERFLTLLAEPAEFAAAVNSELVKVFGGDVSFAAAICGLIDASNGALWLTAAGGPPPLIVRGSDQIQKIEMSGLPLGVLEGATYSVHSLRLDKGDAMLLFSDGAFEIHNAAGEILGVDGLMGLLQEMGYPRTPLSMPALEERLLKFSNAIRMPDDTTIVEARFVGADP
jgi:PAS domain S-box-containing protein